MNVMEGVLNRAKNIHNIDDLRSISKSPVIDLDDISSIKDRFLTLHNVVVEGFDNKELLAVKSTLAGYDDMLTEFPEIQRTLHTIRYVGNIASMGDWCTSGLSRVGKSGLQDYGTGVHEAAHALDYARSIEKGIGYSELIVETARRNLGFRINAADYIRIRMELTADLADARDPREVFAYALESHKGGCGNDFAKEIYKLLKKEV